MDDYEDYEDYEKDEEFELFERDDLNKAFGEGAAKQYGFSIYNIKNNQETKRATTLSSKTDRKRDRVRRIDQDFRMMTFGSIKKMSEKIKIPRVRNSYLREAFFKCYFQGP